MDKIILSLLGLFAVGAIISSATNEDEETTTQDKSETSETIDIDFQDLEDELLKDDESEDIENEDLDEDLDLELEDEIARMEDITGHSASDCLSALNDELEADEELREAIVNTIEA